jgi:hypothetical protein
MKRGVSILISPRYVKRPQNVALEIQDQSVSSVGYCF